MGSNRRAVFVCCDGLSRRWVSETLTPNLTRLSRSGAWCENHKAVFPSVTRVSAATIATGCLPVRHGLHGNRMGLLENGRVVVRDVGAPDFRDHMRRATGCTLKVPTLAERVADLGHFVAFSNVSPGAAYFLDPDNYGYVYHRAGSYAPGGEKLAAPGHLQVSHDVAGDRVMAQRFCDEILTERKPPVAFLWLANPDITMHGVDIGGPEHRAALQGVDEIVQMVVDTVEALRKNGEDILLLIGSDHGQEVIGDMVDVEAFLASIGFESELAEGHISVASQGTSALLYATDAARRKLEDALPKLDGLPWVDSVVVGESLLAMGLPYDETIVAAINMGFIKDSSQHGIEGSRWIAVEPGKTPKLGDGHHGGWGYEETSPFLIVNHPAVGAAKLISETHLVDIAPTILTFLGLPTDGIDGGALLACLN